MARKQLGTATAAAADLITRGEVLSLLAAATGGAVDAARNAFKSINVDPAMCSGVTTVQANTTYVIALHTLVGINISQIILNLQQPVATPTGSSYAALYKADGTLFPASGSADVNGQLTGTTVPATLPLGVACDVPPGRFFAVVRFGAASTLPSLRTAPVTSIQHLNTGLTFTGSTADPTVYPRWGASANAWSGATPPATLGTVTPDFRAWFAGVK